MRIGKAVISALCLALLCLGTEATSFAAEKTYTNSIGMEFVLIPAGSFMMGTDPKVEDDGDDERPRHKVTISKAFYLGKYEVTQAQWEAVMGSNPALVKGPNNPVEHVFWDDVRAFIRKLNQKEGHNRYRLPTEAEWEYAARAGTSTAYSFGDDKNKLSDYAWYDGNSAHSPHPVGEKQPNPWGLHDMHGNVWEWVQDWYGEKYYGSSPGTNPKGPGSGSYRVIRGGSWFIRAVDCRSAARANFSPHNRESYLGLRLALSLK